MTKITFRDVLFSYGSWSVKFKKLLDYTIGSSIAYLLPPLKETEIHPQELRKILIIRPGGIGDAVFLLPILKELRFRGYQLNILCESRNVEVFRSQDYICYQYDSLKDMKEILRDSFDAVVDTEQWHYLSGIMSYFIRSKFKVGFATRVLREKLYNISVNYDENAYELINFIKLFEALSSMEHVQQDINGCFKVPGHLQEWARIRVKSNNITIFLGGSISLRRFSRDQVIFAIKNQLKNGQQIVLLGGEDASLTAKEIMNQCQQDKVINCVGKTSLIETAALIQQSERFIGPDTGFMHVACALNIPVTAFFGPGHLEKWKPQGTQHQIISHHLPCAPCTHFGYTNPTCKGSYACVKDLMLK